MKKKEYISPSIKVHEVKLKSLLTYSVSGEGLHSSEIPDDDITDNCSRRRHSGSDWED